MNSESRYLSQKVKEARGCQSLRRFSQKCGLSHGYIAKIERGINKGSPVRITVHILAKLISGGVEIDFDYLIAASLEKEPVNHKRYSINDVTKQL